MSHALSGVKAFAEKVRHRLATAFRNEAGAFDLTSVLVGAVVVAILVGGTMVTTFGIIPFAQNNAAQQNLNAISTAQGVHKAQTTNGASFAANLTALKTANLVGQDVTGIFVAGDADSWAALSKSASGGWYQSTSKNPTPVSVATPGTGSDADAQTAAGAANTAIT